MDINKIQISSIYKVSIYGSNCNFVYYNVSLSYSFMFDKKIYNFASVTVRKDSNCEKTIDSRNLVVKIQKLKKEIEDAIRYTNFIYSTKEAMELTIHYSFDDGKIVQNPNDIKDYNNNFTKKSISFKVAELLLGSPYEKSDNSFWWPEQTNQSNDNIWIQFNYKP
jgi:hypothetical protein